LPARIDAKKSQCCFCSLVTRKSSVTYPLLAFLDLMHVAPVAPNSSERPWLPPQTPCVFATATQHAPLPTAPDSRQDTWRPLPWTYNAQKVIKYHHPHLWDISKIVNIHYVDAKPWNRDDPGNAPYQDIVAYWWDVYEGRAAGCGRLRAPGPATTKRQGGCACWGGGEGGLSCRWSQVLPFFKRERMERHSGLPMNQSKEWLHRGSLHSAPRWGARRAGRPCRSPDERGTGRLRVKGLGLTRGTGRLGV
jgi:hypothetical protein